MSMENTATASSRPLYVAVKNGHTALAKLLMNKGAYCDFQDEDSGKTFAPPKSNGQ